MDENPTQVSLLGQPVPECSLEEARANCRTFPGTWNTSLCAAPGLGFVLCILC